MKVFLNKVQGWFIISLSWNVKFYIIAAEIVIKFYLIASEIKFQVYLIATKIKFQVLYNSVRDKKFHQNRSFINLHRQWRYCAATIDRLWLIFSFHFIQPFKYHQYSTLEYYFPFVLFNHSKNDNWQYNKYKTGTTIDRLWLIFSFQSTIHHQYSTALKWWHLQF